MSNYPKWKYHAEKPAVIVQSEEAEKALGAGWVESPADLKKQEAPAVKPSAPVEKPAAEAPAPEAKPAPKRKSGRH